MSELLDPGPDEDSLEIEFAPAIDEAVFASVDGFDSVIKVLTPEISGNDAAACSVAMLEFGKPLIGPPNGDCPAGGSGSTVEFAVKESVLGPFSSVLPRLDAGGASCLKTISNCGALWGSSSRARNRRCAASRPF